MQMRRAPVAKIVLSRAVASLRIWSEGNKGRPHRPQIASFTSSTAPELDVDRISSGRRPVAGGMGDVGVQGDGVSFVVGNGPLERIN